MLDRRYIQELFRVLATRERIGHTILIAFAVQNLVLKPEKPRKHFLLPCGMKPLLIKMCEALMIGVDEELYLEQVMSPGINSHENRQILLFIDRQASVFGA